MTDVFPFLVNRRDSMKSLYTKCVDIYDDYRRVVPPYAPAALAFYLLLILIPAFSLVAVGTSLLKIDLSLVEDILHRIIMPEYANMLLEILKSKNVNTVALVTMIASLYTVSRGVGNIYEISKNMYPMDRDENIISYYIYTIKVTIFLLLLFIGILGILAIGPLAYIFHFLYSLYGIRHIMLYFIMVLCMMSIYLIVPRIRVCYLDAFQGALVASGLMLVLYYGLNIYFRFADFQTVYGPLSFIIVILFVFNLVAEIFYIGMYITKVLYMRRIDDGESRN